MLSYNDALAHNQPSEATCIVCHDLQSAERIIWHKIRLPRYLDEQTIIAEDQREQVVPICVDCADLFHDVKPS